MRHGAAVVGLAVWLGACGAPAVAVGPPATPLPVATVNPAEPWKLTATAEALPPTVAPVATRGIAATPAPLATRVPAAAAPPATLAPAAGGYAITVNTWSDAPPTTLAPAHSGLQYLAFDVTVANRGTRPIPYNPLYFKVKDTQDVEYATALMAGSGRQLAPLQAGELAPGAQVRGLLVFEVPQGGQLTQLEYHPIQLGNSARVVTRLTQ